jgi:hypothetical protein
MNSQGHGPSRKGDFIFARNLKKIGTANWEINALIGGSCKAPDYRRTFWQKRE